MDILSLKKIFFIVENCKIFTVENLCFHAFLWIIGGEKVPGTFLWAAGAFLGQLVTNWHRFNLRGLDKVYTYGTFLAFLLVPGWHLSFLRE
jgi:hypothetical protein